MELIVLQKEIYDMISQQHAENLSLNVLWSLEVFLSCLLTIHTVLLINLGLISFCSCRKRWMLGDGFMDYTLNMLICVFFLSSLNKWLFYSSAFYTLLLCVLSSAFFTLFDRPFSFHEYVPPLPSYGFYCFLIHSLSSSSSGCISGLMFHPVWWLWHFLIPLLLHLMVLDFYILNFLVLSSVACIPSCAQCLITGICQ